MRGDKREGKKQTDIKKKKKESEIYRSRERERERREVRK